MSMLDQADASGYDVAINLDAAVQDQFSTSVDRISGEVHEAAVIGEDADLSRLHRLIGSRTGRWRDRDVEQASHDYRMLRVPLHRHHQHL